MTATEKIDTILKERKMSRRQLAKKAGIPPTTFQSAMERGTIRTDSLLKIAMALDTTIFNLMDEDKGRFVQGILEGRFTPADVARKLDIPERAVWETIFLPWLYNEDLRSIVYSVGGQLYDNPAQVRGGVTEITQYMNLLNEEGQRKAVERVKEVAEIPKYQKAPLQGGEASKEGEGS